jgi:hypothetical protein
MKHKMKHIMENIMEKYQSSDEPAHTVEQNKADSAGTERTIMIAKHEAYDEIFQSVFTAV